MIRARRMRRGIFRTRGVVVIGAALLAVTMMVAPAVADPADSPRPKPELTAPSPPPSGPPPAGFKSWDEVYATQGRLHTAAKEILTTNSDGYAGVVAAPENREVRIYWKGTVPEELRAIAAQTGVPVKFLPARFTRREMVAEAKRLSYDSRVAMIAPKVNGGGLDVTVNTNTLAAGKSDLLSTARLPLTTVTGKRPRPLIAKPDKAAASSNQLTQLDTFSRQFDGIPYWGGSRYTSDINVCSNGFAVSIPAGSNHYMLTAAHCGNSGSPVLVPGPPFFDIVGDFVVDGNAPDTAIIRYPYDPFGVQGRIYVDSYTSSWSEAVGGAIENFIGDFVCTGGASSGEHCFELEVIATDLVFTSGFGPFSVAASPSGGCVVAPGDSGGPVYSYDRDDGRVNGRGTISLASRELNPATCPGPYPDGSSVVYYAPLVALPGEDPGALQRYGIDVMTD